MRVTDHHKLLLAMHRGHEPSAEKLWGLFAPRLLAYAAAVLPKDQQHTADDVVQGVFCSVIESPRRELKQIEDVPAWFFRVTRNRALNHARAEQRERDRRPQPSPMKGAQGVAQSDNPNAELRTAVDRLPDEHWDIILLRHVGGLTLDQAAIALGVNRSTVASRHRTAVHSLREMLGAGQHESGALEPKEADHAEA